MASDITNSNLNLGPEEKRFYGQLFSRADTEGLGVVTGDVAVKFFERTKLDATTLGEIWQIADVENRGLLTPAGFSIVLRLIGHCQNGQQPSAEIARQPGPLPFFEGMGLPAPPQPASPANAARTASPQLTGGPVRVPPLSPDKVAEYSMLFERAGAQNGVLGGEAAKTMFERARLPNETLGRIWTLSDTEERGALNLTEFVIAMHLIFSMRSGALRTLPQTLPPGLYEAASRRVPPAPVPRPMSGQGTGRMQSPTSRAPFRAPPPPMAAQTTGGDWLVTPQDKAKFDQIFATLDPPGTGYISGDQAVTFMGSSGLSEDTLASIWDLANINKDGRLSRDEFAVAMYLIRQQRSKAGNLPETLPPMLVPPSLRPRAVPPPSQPTVAAFDDNAFAAPQTKSSADDLFGLDALSSEPPAAPVTSGSAQGSPSLSRSIQSPQTTGQALTQSPQTTGTAFKPFMPTSAFGQTITQQQTGSTAPTPAAAASGQGVSRSIADDLLGDNDPEVSSRLTQETTELGNMSNQISTLRNQVQEVQTQKTAGETNLVAAGNQKRELETKLAQFRTQYEEEVRQVKSLRERLDTSRAETRKIQQELAMLEGTHQDLKTQHQQVASALEADQRENASLKERTRVLNEEVAQLRPQLEKMRSDARQQKGMVAINKKQVATVEGEKDKVQKEMSDLEAEKEEMSRSLQASPEPSSQAVASPPITSPPAASPSAQSTNPFFRMTSSESIDRQLSPSIFSQNFGGQSQQSTQSAFDSVFGVNQPQSNPSEPPPVTFRSGTPPESSRSLEESATSTPAAIHQDSPVVEPPAPPESRQLTSSILPLRGDLHRSESFGSSVKAIPPASRAGMSNTATPTRFASSPATSVDENEVSSRGLDGEGSATEVPSTTSVPVQASGAETFGPPLSLQSSIPGSFPVDTPTTPTASAGGGDERSTSAALSDALQQSRDSSQKASFDEVFGSNENLQSTSGPSTRTIPEPPTTETSQSKSEFPPIQEFDADDSDSDDASEQGFEDDFAPTSPPQPTDHGVVAVPPAISSSETTQPTTVAKPSVSELESGDSSRIPTPAPQQLPPTYNQSVPPPSTSEERNVNEFPAEYGGLLPSREMATSDERPATPPNAKDTPTSLNPFTNGISSNSQPVAASSTAADDFDSAFDDLTESHVEDESGADAILARQTEESDFNPTFDSPAPSKATTFTAATPPPIARTAGFSAFEQSFNESSAPAPPPKFDSQAATTSATSSQHDWDALFEGLDNSNTLQNGGDDPFDLGKPSTSTAATGSEGFGMLSTSSAAGSRPAPPPRQPSLGPEHDDPILKRLTGMGFPRDQALSALEQYDYNIDKAIDHLASKS